MTIDEMRNKLEKTLSKKRFKHSLGVMYTAVDLAKIYGVDVEKAAVSGLLHDCAREIKGAEVFKACEKYGIEIDVFTRNQPSLLHGSIGAEIAREEYGIKDRSVLTAIKYHTTGRADMDMLEKIIYIADYIEPGRSFQGVEEARKEAFKDIDRTMLMALDRTINHIIEKKSYIHVDAIHARNYILEQMGNVKY
ncbi:MAG TPA: bis(5'-nucleosyl)-tetraphosphatase (symmetrical) YqeK [Pseudobacteroides sp.]|uniref:bis(5'-nucleosyl)-tetraphosphatase (symmetrical) YqeK n=1 Tax=Pseudobacteroides sp. TaxID=1968840 RepID=UPI002F938ADB